VAINQSEHIAVLDAIIGDSMLGGIRRKEAWAALWALDEQRDELYAALRWYVENDDTNVGQEGNEFWEAGKKQAQAVLAKVEGGL
jgi:hypothetical protein